jgi:RimJ/RimL family protein N-acetyltransferase
MSVAPAKSAPAPVVLEGRYVRLEPIGVEHAPDLFAASSGQDERYRWLFEYAPASVAELEDWITVTRARTDLVMFAVIDKSTGRAEGRQSLMRFVPKDGVIEIGNIYWGLRMARSRLATEALYVFARHSFDDLGYRRFEWKCNALNEPSRRAAQRFGFQFEGVFRQHMIVKGLSSDTAWFSIIDGEWPALRAEYERWLALENFDAEGQQKTPLRTR